MIELHALIGGSELIARWGWEPHPTPADPEEGILALEFHEGGVWHYLGVPGRVFEEFLLANSKGRFFMARVRGKYQAERVDEPM